MTNRTVSGRDRKRALVPKNPAKIERIFEMLEEGWTYDRISSAFGFSKAYVSRVVKRYKDTEWDVRTDKRDRPRGRPSSDEGDTERH